MPDDNYDIDDQQGQELQDEQDSDFVPPKDGSWVPRKVMNERVGAAVTKVEQQLQAEREARIRMEEQIKHLSESQQAQQQQKQETTYSLAQLRAYVDDGKISQEQADQIFERQIEQKFESKLTAAMSQQQQQNTSIATVESGLNAYLELIPDLMAEGSENRTKVAAEYNKLVSVFGAAKADSLEDKKLQLVALQNAFGDANALRQQKASRRNTAGDRDTHEESAGQVDETLSEGDNKVMKGMNKARRDYYRKMIDKGFYKGWKEVGEELKYVRR